MDSTTVTGRQALLRYAGARLTQGDTLAAALAFQAVASGGTGDSMGVAAAAHLAALGISTSAGDAFEAVRRSELEPEQLSAVFVGPLQGPLRGTVPVTALVRAEPGRQLEELVKHEIPSLSPDTSFEEVARVMADYNLTALPVADEHERMIGVITVDDVLEAMLPRAWRRRFGLLGED